MIEARGRADAVHRAGEPVGERVHRVTQREDARRTASPRAVRHVEGSEGVRWRIHYNTVRPHSILGYRPPAPEMVAAERLHR